MLPMPQVQVYSKPRCSLCDRALATLRDIQQRLPFVLEVTDITLSPSLWERFRFDVPVVFINGRRVFHHRVEAGAFEEKLREAGGTGVAPNGDTE